jgi:hypothetical protein
MGLQLTVNRFASFFAPLLLLANFVLIISCVNLVTSLLHMYYGGSGGWASHEFRSAEVAAFSIALASPILLCICVSAVNFSFADITECTWRLITSIAVSTKMQSADRDDALALVDILKYRGQVGS